MYRDIILSKIKEYCRLKNIECHATKVVTLHCVFCDRPGKTAQVMPNSSTIYCHHCIDDQTRKYNIIDIARKVEDKPEASDEEILTLIKNQLKLDVHTAGDDEEVMNYLAKFETRGWCLVPCARNDKYPVQQEWQKKQNREKSEWFHWYKSGLNLGVRTGESSNLCVIDLDFLTKDEKVEWAKETTTPNRRQQIEAKKVIPAEIKAVMGEPLVQETLGGFHLCYQACDLPKGVVVIAGIHVDIETEGGQVIIYPSPKTAIFEDYKANPEDKDVKKRIVGFAKRRWTNDVPIPKIPQAFYDLLQKLRPKSSAVITEDDVDEEIQQAIKDENVKVKDFVNNRNNTLIKYGGILRKSMNILEVKRAVTVFNNMVFPDPLPRVELDRIVESLDKYIDDNEAVTTNGIVEYLTETDTASKAEIELAVFGKRAIGEEKLRLDKALMNLQIRRSITKQGFRYKLIKKMNWQEDFTNVGAGIDFKMPYFEDYAHFNKGDIIIIGGQTKFGKTTLALNFVKRIVVQGKKPYYLFNETGGRFGKTAFKLGMKPGDFKYTYAKNAEDIILEPNGIYIYDWIRPVDFAKTADLFDSIVEKLQESNSVMIGMVQLRDKNEWFAKDMLRQFVAMSAKYVYEDEEGINNKFEIGDIRDRKVMGKNFVIPCKYIEETREVKMQEEIEEEERLEQAKKDAQHDKTKQGNSDNQGGNRQGPNNQTAFPG